MINGNASMPNPAGGTMTGRLGTGFARITLAEAVSFTAGAQTGSITVSGGVNVRAIETAATAHNIALASSTGNVTIGSNAVFKNTGTLQIGSSAGTQSGSITGSLAATAPSLVSLGANITTTTTQAYAAASL
jgi:hypothetical protein